MLGTTVYFAVLDAIRKDLRGNKLQLEEYNRLSAIVSRRLFTDYAKKFEEDIESSDTLGNFKKFDQAISLVSGVGTLPADYERIIGEPWYTDTVSDPSATRNLPIVTSLQHSKRRTDYLTQASTTYPYCQIGSENASGGKQIKVYPSTISTVYIDYLREPQTPYLDYYVNDTTFEVTYLTEGQSVTITSGSTYRDGTTGAKTSITQDWEFSEDDLPLIVAYFRSEMGGTIPDELQLQKGELDKSQMK